MKKEKVPITMDDVLYFHITQLPTIECFTFFPILIDKILYLLHFSELHLMKFYALHFFSKYD